MKKLTTTLLLAAALATGVTPAAFAASDEALNAANALYKQGLFLGNGTTATGAPNFELDRKPTRHEAITMLVRLLGKEEEAKKGTWNTPFTDVDEWAKPYVGYAYTNKLTTGTSETTFSGNDTVTATEYLTLVLRVLGYDDKKGDFSWDKAWELSDKIGLTKGQYNADTNNFTRGDVAIVSQATAEKKAETDKKPEDDKKQETEQPKADDQEVEQPSNNDTADQKKTDAQKPTENSNQSDNQETKTAKLVRSWQPTIYEKDGLYYKGEVGLVSYGGVVEYEVGGETKRYIQNGASLHRLFDIIMGNTVVIKEASSDTVGEIRRGMNYKSENDGKKDTFYLSDVFTVENITDENHITTATYNNDGKKCVMVLNTTEHEGKILTQDGLQCVSDGRYVYVGLQDVLDKLGVEGTFSIKEIADVGIVWSFK